MAKAAAPIRFMADHDILTAPLDALRALIVCGCAMALILAGQALPF